MNRIYALTLLMFCLSNGISQNIPTELVYPVRLKSNQDSFSILHSMIQVERRFEINHRDTINYGNDGREGDYWLIWTDIDTLKISNVNYPYSQRIEIPIISPRDSSACVLRFGGSSSNFTTQYIDENSGKVKIDIPAVFELANVILYLSDYSDLTNNRPFNTVYQEKVENYFSKYRNHALIKTLNQLAKEQPLFDVYYGFRENSLCYRLEDGKLIYDSPYKSVWFDDTWIRGGYFRNLLYLIQDFVKESNYTAFYKANEAYYTELKLLERDILPVKKMWDWIEEEFPYEFNHYKIILSPLIEVSHSTQQFRKSQSEPESEYKECVMFMNTSESIRTFNYSKGIKEGLRLGKIFTEVDHNYVNPTSFEHRELIRSIFSEKGKWASEKAQSRYNDELSIFNEYMTHSLFCLYVLENYQKTDADKVIEERIQLMNKRGFMKFEEFNSILCEKMLNSDESLYDRYEEIILVVKERIK